MDLSKLKTTDYLVGGGAVVFLLSMFFKWYKVDVSGAFGGSFGVNGWHYTFQGILPLLLIIAVFVALVLPAITGNDVVPDPVGPLPRKQAALIASGVALALVLLRIIVTDGPSEIVERGLGIFLAFLASIAVFVGTLMKSQGTEDIKSVKMPNQNDFGGGPSGPPQQF